MIKEKKLMIYKEYYKKYFGKRTAHDILFGWFGYCHKNKIDPQTSKPLKK